MLSDQAWNLLLQIPLAGVVVFVVWMFLKHLDKSNQRQEAIQREMLTFIAQQEQLNRDFLTAQREATDQSLKDFGERLGAISNEVSRMNGILSAHDARSQERGSR